VGGGAFAAGNRAFAVTGAFTAAGPLRHQGLYGSRAFTAAGPLRQQGLYGSRACGCGGAIMAKNELFQVQLRRPFWQPLRWKTGVALDAAAAPFVADRVGAFCGPTWTVGGGGGIP